MSTPDVPSTAESLAPIALGPTLELGWQLFKRSLPRCLPLALLAVLIGQLPAVYLLNMADRGAVWLLLRLLWLLRLQAIAQSSNSLSSLDSRFQSQFYLELIYP